MSSWFGGPSPSHRSHSHHRRDSSPKGYFVRPKSPTRHHSSENKGYFMRAHSPARSTTSNFSRSLFGGGSRHNSSSYYKRRPRDGYISQLVHKIKRLLKDLIRFAQRNPIKVFMLVIMPLVTGGALHGILKGMGVRLPAGMERMMGGGRGGYGGHGGHGEYERRGGGSGGFDIGQVMNIAKMFV